MDPIFSETVSILIDMFHSAMWIEILCVPSRRFLHCVVSDNHSDATELLIMQINHIPFTRSTRLQAPAVQAS